MQLPSPNNDTFQLSQAPRPMREAVEQLAQDLGRPLSEMENLTLGKLTQLAQECYGSELPFFWKNWIDWARPEGPQPMGEL
jgi:hypothetical protein